MLNSASVRSMTRKQRRGVLIATAVGILSVAVFLVLFALRDTIVFFHTPKEMAERQIPAGKRIRLGGLVAEASVKRGFGQTVEFAITDTIKTIQVATPASSRTCSARARASSPKACSTPSGRFLADTVLAKHDENYMPPEVAKALKEQGVWQRDGKGEGAARRNEATCSMGLSSRAFAEERHGTRGDA